MPRKSGRVDQVEFEYPPAVTAGDPFCYAPLTEVGMGTGTGAVRCHHTGKRFAFRADSLTLIHGVLCIRCESLGCEGGVHTGRLPTGDLIGVRDPRDVFAAARGLKLYTADTAA